MTTAAAEAREAAQTNELVLAGLLGQLQQSNTTHSQLSAGPLVTAAVNVSAPDPAHDSARVLRASADLPGPLSAMIGTAACPATHSSPTAPSCLLCSSTPSPQRK